MVNPFNRRHRVTTRIIPTVPACLCPQGLLIYSRQTSALHGTADLLLDAASYGIRWAGCSESPAAGRPAARLTTESESTVTAAPIMIDSAESRPVMTSREMIN